jgi:hypothetical protein
MVDSQEVQKINCCTFGGSGQTLIVGTDTGFKIFSISVPQEF